MNINAYSTIVRIRAMNINIDWSEPYKKESSQSIGTGFFIDTQGHLITCSHVVENAVKLLITIPEEGNKEFETEILSIHPELDIALLKTKFKNKSYLKLGDSDNIENGQDVIALGYPLGQSKLKFTKGIISGLQNSMIQTDTPLNPGNSGGPLMDIKGNVIGINTSGILDAENVGYATPIYFFKKIEPELKTKSIIYLPKIGLVLESTPEISKYFFNMKKECNSGLYIKKIIKKYFDKKKKLEEQDIICKINHHKLDNKGECQVPWSKESVPLKHILKRFLPGESIILSCWSHKNNNYYTEKYKLKGTNDLFRIRNYYPLYEKIEYEIFVGCIFMQLANNHLKNYEGSVTNDILNYMKIQNRGENIIIITHIFPSSTTGKERILKPYSVISKINGKKVPTLDKLLKAFQQPIKKGNKEYITIESIDNSLMVYELDKIIQEEITSSQIYNYQLTPIGQYFVKKYIDNQQQSQKKVGKKN